MDRIVGQHDGVVQHLLRRGVEDLGVVTGGRSRRPDLSGLSHQRLSSLLTPVSCATGTGRGQIGNATTTPETGIEI